MFGFRSGDTKFIPVWSLRPVYMNKPMEMVDERAMRSIRFRFPLLVASGFAVVVVAMPRDDEANPAPRCCSGDARNALLVVPVLADTKRCLDAEATLHDAPSGARK